MDTAGRSERASVERTSDRETVVSRIVNAPPRIVFEAWTKAELFARWWVPASAPMKLLSCEIDARVGGRYRLAFEVGGRTMEFFGTYLEVTPPSRLSWTNEEGDEGGAITTVTFEETDGKTRIVVHDLYPSKEALDDAIASGSTSGMPEQLDQLDAFVAETRAPGGSRGA